MCSGHCSETLPSVRSFLSLKFEVYDSLLHLSIARPARLHTCVQNQSHFISLEHVRDGIRIQTGLASRSPDEWLGIDRSVALRCSRSFVDDRQQADSISEVCSHCLSPSYLVAFSDQAIFEQGKAIRGGVPIVWPQFGPGVLPQHGFARVKNWRLGKTSTTDSVSVDLNLSDDDETLKVWPHKFNLTVTIRLTARSFHQELTVDNRDDHGFDFTALFHTYFTVSDIKATKVYV